MERPRGQLRPVGPSVCLSEAWGRRGQAHQRLEILEYAICADTLPRWSWLPASTYQGTLRRDGAENTSSKVSCSQQKRHPHFRVEQLP